MTAVKVWGDGFTEEHEAQEAVRRIEEEGVEATAHPPRLFKDGWIVTVDEEDVEVAEARLKRDGFL